MLQMHFHDLIQFNLSAHKCKHDLHVHRFRPSVNLNTVLMQFSLNIIMDDPSYSLLMPTLHNMGLRRQEAF